jgi:signal transduction histidine kinase
MGEEGAPEPQPVTLREIADRVSHDLNNLLMPILGYAELFVQETRQGPQATWAAEIHRAAERAQALVTELRQAIKLAPGG